MSKTYLLGAALLAALIALTAGCGGDTGRKAPAKKRNIAAPAIKSRYVSGIERLEEAVAMLERATRDTATRNADVRSRFREARDLYKRIEYLVEYLSPATARSLNGPPLDEADEENPTVPIPPTGFQVMEELLYPETAEEYRAEMLDLIAHMRSHLRRLRQLVAGFELTDTHVFEAMRLGVVRIVALGLAGFDSPVAGRSLAESAVALEGMREALAPYMESLQTAAPRERERLAAGLDTAIAELAGAGDFASFDRLEFIRRRANPLFADLLGAQRTLRVELPTGRRFLRPTATTIFDIDAFDAGYHAPSWARHDGPTVELGRVLFFDPVLSGNGRRACASCHDPERGFTDGLPKSTAFDFAGSVTRNAPTVVNAALQAGLFYDLRAVTLEDQAMMVVNNPAEMHGSLGASAAKIRASQGYASLFAEAFGRGDSAVSERSIRAAIAAYIRSLASLDSPFDRYMRGEENALAPEARRGFNLFMGKGKCGACHFAPLFNGTVPPAFVKSELEIIGVPAKPGLGRGPIDSDQGRFAVLGIELDRFKFKTPTVRNVAVTAPYMHNGVFRTLEEVIEFYDRGGGQGIGIDVPGQTLPADPLRLTPAEKRDLIAFLGALTDTTGLTARPVSLPALPGAAVAVRKVGGEY